ncbi:MAG: DUF11 domain-containing protein, partial [Caldilineaceae bacterium]
PSAPMLLATNRDHLIDDLNGDGLAGPGDTIAYDIQIRNLGQSSATNVLFRSALDSHTVLAPDSLSVGGSSDDAADLQAVEVVIGVIPAGGVASMSYEVTVIDSLAPSIRQIANQGMILSAELPTVVTDDPDTERNGDATMTLLHMQPRIEVHKSDLLVHDADSSGAPSFGDELLYVITIANQGNLTATGVYLLDHLDMRLSIVANSLSSTHGSIASIDIGATQQIGVQIGDLDAGESATVRFRTTIVATYTENTTRLLNQALVGGDNIPLTPSDDPETDIEGDPTTTILVQEPVLIATLRDQLIVDKDRNGEPSAGDVLLYQVTIRNAGSASAHILSYEDRVAPNTTLDAKSIQTSQGRTSAYTESGNAHVRVDADSLSPGDQINISYRVTVDDNIPADVAWIENQGLVSYLEGVAILTDDPDTPARHDSTKTDITATARLDATKTDLLLVDANNDSQPSPGDTLLYQVKIANQGNGAAQHVVFADTPDEHTSLLNRTVNTSHGAVVTGDADGDTSILVEIDEIPAGHAVWISYQVVIDSDLPADVTMIRNQGRYWSEGMTPTRTNDPETLLLNDATGTNVGGQASIEVYLHDARVDAANNLVLYQVTIENNSHLPARSVIYQDALTSKTRLAANSVHASQGTKSGNDDSRVYIKVGDIPAGERVSISYLVEVTERLADDVTVIWAQGRASSESQSNIPSDDPSTMEEDDHTETVLPMPPRLYIPNVVVLPVTPRQRRSLGWRAARRRVATLPA